MNGDGRGDGRGDVSSDVTAKQQEPQPPPEKKVKAGKKSGGIHVLSYKKTKPSAPPTNEVYYINDCFCERK